MRRHLVAVALVAGLALARRGDADTFVPGGGPGATDCWAGWRVAGNGAFDTGRIPWRYRASCIDGDPTCDVDGQTDGQCTFDVSICVLQPGDARCRPSDAGAIRKITVTRSDATRDAGISRPRGPHLPASGAACGAPTRMQVPLRHLSHRSARSRVFGLRMISTSSAVSPDTGTFRRDSDRLELRCVPSPPRDCSDHPNPDGGPGMLALSSPADGAGTDLDLGWNGLAHDFPIPGPTRIAYCLAGCDGADRSSCAGTAYTGGLTLNGRTFGPPQPLLALNTPVCLVHRFDGDQHATADYRSGTIDASLDLLTDFYITTTAPDSARGQVCPQCSGAAVGDAGVCIGGRAPGLTCRVQAIGFVPDSTGGSTDYHLSSDCLPTGFPVATWKLHAPLTTGTSALTGPLPCLGQLRDDGCGEDAACDATCTDTTCASTTPDPADPAHLVCVDRQGGLAQRCCSDDTRLPCYPTRNGGTLARTGRPAPLVPDGPDSAFPATATPVLASVACAVPTGSIVLDSTLMGTPGPVALVLPVTARWTP